MSLTHTTWGDPSSPRAAVLLHGITSNAAGWNRVAPRLVERGFYVVAPDLTGHGDNAPPRPGFSHDDMIQDIVDTVPASIDLLIGHSLGGYLALKAATEGHLTPRRLVLEDPVPVLHRHHASTFIDSSEAAPRDAAGIARANPRWHPDDVAAKVTALGQIDWRVMRSILVDLAPWDLRERLPTLAGRVPTLYLLADPSNTVPPAHAREIQRVLGPDSVAVLPGAGHNLHRDDLEGFLKALFEWLDLHAETQRPAARVEV